MEWIGKLIEWVKLPVGFVALASSMVSGALLLLKKETLENLSLLQLRIKYGEIIGIVFVVSLSLLIAYIIFTLPKFLKHQYRRIVYKHFPDRVLRELNDVELSCLLSIYNAPNHVRKVDKNNPIIAGLSARNMIHFGGTQVVEYDTFSNTWPVQYTLQPFAQKGITRFYDKLNKDIEELEGKFERCSDTIKKTLIEKALNEQKNTLQRWRSM